MLDDFKQARELEIESVYSIPLHKHVDERGAFMRLFEISTLSKHMGSIVQTNIAYNEHAGIWRGLHYQLPPSRECKVICCIAGVVDDFLFDTREQSPTFERLLKVRLDHTSPQLIVVPCGVAHGYQTLTKNVIMAYGHSDFHRPELECGIQYQTVGIEPLLEKAISVISQRDENLPHWRQTHEL